MFKLENNFAFLWMMVATYTKSNRYNIGEFFWVIDTREWYRFFAVRCFYIFVLILKITERSATVDRLGTSPSCLKVFKIAAREGPCK